MTIPTVTILPFSWESLTVAQAGSGVPASAVWIAANRAVFIPFRLTDSITVVKMFMLNGATVSGNIDVGIYDALGTRLVSKGSTAQAGINAIQEFDITDTRLGPGLFYMASAMDNATGTVLRKSVNGIILRTAGLFQMASAFPLPATATFAANSGSFLPTVGLTIRSLI